MEKVTCRSAPATALTGTYDPVIITDKNITCLAQGFNQLANSAEQRAAADEARATAYLRITAEALVAVAGLAALARDVSVEDGEAAP